MTTDILTVTDLKKHFVIGHSGILKREPITVKAVDGISFAIREGETFGLVGESGSGKSTVAYTTIGMYRPTAGSIGFRGQNLFEGNKKRPLALKKEIQIVFQDPGSSLNPRRSIKQILELPLQIHRRDENRPDQVVRLLEMAELPPDYMHKYPQMLGGGEKQMVAIARALATDPSFIILDEPTSALDVSIQGKIINLLIRLQNEFHLSYLFITHDLSLMRNVASRKRRRSSGPKRSSPPARFRVRSTSPAVAASTCVAPREWISVPEWIRSWSRLRRDVRSVATFTASLTSLAVSC